MHSDIELHDFICEVHPTQMIKYICNSLSSSKRLYCDQCVVEADRTINPTLIRFENFLHEAEEALRKISTLKAESRVPDHILETLRKRDELISKFTLHIETMKQKSLKEFENLEGEIMKVIKKSKDSLIHNLDFQLAAFKQNIDDYANKIKRHFDFGERINPPSLQELYEEMNNCQSYQELEVKLRSYITEMEESEELVDEGVSNRDLVIIDSVNQIRNHILETIKNLPTPRIFQTNFDYTDLFDVLKTRINDFLNQLTTVSGEVMNIKSMSIDSKIANYSDLGLIRKWINADGKSTLKLFTRLKFASDFDDAMKKALVIPKILVLVRSQSGDTFGCYRILGKSTVTFSLSDQKVNYDLSVISHPIGTYVLSTTMSFTWRDKCKYNSTVHDQLKKYKDGTLEKAICIARIDLNDDDAAPERIRIQKRYHFIQDFEIFELSSEI